MNNLKLLEILICPITKEKLLIATDQTLSDLNSKIERHEIRNNKGEIVETKLEKALINNAKTFIYPVMSEIPVLLPDEAIPLSGN